jgi:hypothetical protein
VPPVSSMLPIHQWLRACCRRAPFLQLRSSWVVVPTIGPYGAPRGRHRIGLGHWFPGGQRHGWPVISRVSAPPSTGEHARTARTTHSSVRPPGAVPVQAKPSTTRLVVAQPAEPQRDGISHRKRQDLTLNGCHATAMLSISMRHHTTRLLSPHVSRPSSFMHLSHLTIESIICETSTRLACPPPPSLDATRGPSPGMRPGTHSARCSAAHCTVPY